MYGTSHALATPALTTHSSAATADRPITTATLQALEQQLLKAGVADLPITCRLLAAGRYLQTGDITGFTSRPAAPSRDVRTGPANLGDRVRAWLAKPLFAPAAPPRPAPQPSLPELLAPMHARGVPFVLHLGMSSERLDDAASIGLLDRGLRDLPRERISRWPMDTITKIRTGETSDQRLLRIRDEVREMVGGLVGEQLRPNDCALVVVPGACCLLAAKDSDGQWAVVDDLRPLGKPAHPPVQITRGEAAKNCIDRMLLQPAGSEWAVVMMPHPR